MLQIHGTAKDEIKYFGSYGMIYKRKARCIKGVHLYTVSMTCTYLQQNHILFGSFQYLCTQFQFKKCLNCRMHFKPLLYVVVFLQ